MNGLKKLWQKQGQKLLVLGLWLGILGGYWGYTSLYNLSPVETARQLGEFLQTSLYGPVIFIALYLVRPLLFFPTSILTLLAGFLFGPLLGVACVFSGNIIASMVAYVVGYYFGQDWLTFDRSLIKRYTAYVKDNAFEAVLLMRLLLLNFDLVSYVSGLLRVNWQAFVWGTALGSTAGAISYVLAGASIEGQFTGQLPTLNPWMLGIAALLFAASFILAWYLRRTT